MIWNKGALDSVLMLATCNRDTAIKWNEGMEDEILKKQLMWLRIHVQISVYLLSVSRDSVVI